MAVIHRPTTRAELNALHCSCTIEMHPRLARPIFRDDAHLRAAAALRHRLDAEREARKTHS